MIEFVPSVDFLPQNNHNLWPGQLNNGGQKD